MWSNVAYFLEAVMPAAEQAGVRMSLHPDDPPISPIAGIARVFRSHEALARLVDLVPSDCNGLGFCQGTISEMPGNVLDAIRYFGSRDKINYVHFRFVSGPVPAFSETFIDQGHVDPMESLLAYDEAGVDCPMIDDHVPRLATDPEGQHNTSRALCAGLHEGAVGQRRTMPGRCGVIRVDRDRFLEEGFLVLRGMISPRDLDVLRRSYEILVDRQRSIWTDERLGARRRPTCGGLRPSRG